MLLGNLASIIGAVVLGIVCLSMIIFVGRRAYAFFRGNANPTISTFDYLKEHMKSLDLKPGSKFIDLGCGTGSTLRWFAKQYPAITYTGVDINTLALRWGHWKIKNSGVDTITLQHQDIYTVNLNKYDYIYCFLMPSEMKRIQLHFEKSITTPTTIICAAFKLPDRVPTSTIRDAAGADKIFIYRK